MIERYSLKEISYVWEEENKVKKWLDVELAVVDSFYKFKIINKEIRDDIFNKATFNLPRIKEIEIETKHDVIAFLTNLEEYIGENSRWIHFGLTSSDIVDTGFALQLKESGEIILSKLNKLLEIVKQKAFEYKNTIMIGRSHGIHAEPITLGFVFANWYAELERNKHRLVNGIEAVSVGQISGAVGTFSFLEPEIEESVCKSLNLNFDKISTQVISRDRHLDFFYSLSAIAATLDKFAITIRHLQRTEVKEVEEYFHIKQKGSSAMPHKKNPISLENISGLSRIIKSNLITAFENVPLWHERDISHSSAERIIAPDSTILTFYILDRFEKVIKDLVVNKENMLKNLNMTNGLIYSQGVLLKLTQKGIKRQLCYEIVQRNAMNSINNKSNFIDELLKDNELLNLISKEEITECFNLEYYTRNINKIFQRVFIN